MAKGPLARRESQHYDRADYHEIGYVGHGLGYGYAAFGSVEKIDRLEATCRNGCQHYGGDPGHPDQVLDPVVSVAGPLVLDGKAGLLQSCGRTSPAAEQPADKQSANQLQCEYDEAPSYNSLMSSHDYQHR